MKEIKELFDKPVSRRNFLIAIAAGMATVDWTKIEALAAKVGPKSDYPVIVIGAGLGGLTAATYLARNSFPVTLIEQHDIPGGYATSFDRGAGKFTFEVSLHATAGIAQILEECGVKDKVELIRLPELCRIITPDYDLIWPQKDPEGIIRILSEKFPQEAKGIRSAIGQMVDIIQEAKKPFDEKSFLSKILFWYTHPIMWSMRNQTLAQVLDKHIKDPKLKAILSVFWAYYGLPPSKLSGFLYTIAMGSYILAGAEYIRRRSQDLSNALMDTIEKHGGRVILRTEAKNILTKDGNVVGVRTADSKTYTARAVISNANAPATFEKMLPPGAVPDNYMAKLRTYQPSVSSFVVWLGLKKEIRGKIKGYEIFVGSGYDPEADYKASLAADASKASFGVAVYDNVYPGYSKPGKSSVTLTMMCGYEPWKRFETDYFAGRKKAYQKEKDRITQILIERAEARVIPGLRSMIEVMDAATPLTNVRYTKNPKGAILGYEWSMNNAFMNRIKNQTPVKGLYLASAWGNPGGGFSGVMRGGQSTFKALMEDWGHKT